MIVVIGLAVLVVVTVALLGGGALMGTHRPTRSGFGPVALLVGAGGVGIVTVLLLGAVLGVGGLRATRSDPTAAERPEAPPSPERHEVSAEVSVPVVGPRATLDGLAVLDADRSGLQPPPSIGGLRDGDVVDVRATGFAGGGEGVIAQCPDLGAEHCRNVYPVRADDHGRLYLPYRLLERVDSRTLVVEIDGQRAGAVLVFGQAAAAPARLEVDDGIVRLSGGRPDGVLRIARCPSAATTIGQCRTGKSLRISADGSARVEIERGSGDPRIVAVDEVGHVLVGPIVIAGRRGAAVGHDPTRLVGGFSVALALLAIAVRLIRSTDWRPPTEAATPGLDAVALDA